MSPLTRAPWQRPKPRLTLRGSTIDPALRALIRNRAGGRCECCGDPLPWPWHAHHCALCHRIHGYGCEPSNCPCGHTLFCDCWSVRDER